MRNFLIILFLSMGLSAFSQVTEEPSGKFSGLFFIDYYYNAQRDTGFNALPNKAVTGDQNVHGVQIRRIYFSYDYRFNSKLSSKFRLESDEANFTTSSDANTAKKFGMFVKDAYVKWNVLEKLDIIVGIQGTPAFSISEMVWENRYIEKTIMDLRKIVPSRDLAISVKGKIDDNGIFKYWLMYGNNNAGNPENDKYKRYFAQLEIKPIENLFVTLYSDYQSRKPIENSFTPGANLSNNTLTLAGFVGYRIKEKFSGGIEMYYSSTQNDYILTNSYTDKNNIGLSFFGTYYINPKVNLFGRFDYLEPNHHITAKGDVRNLIIAGMAYKPTEKLIVSPNIFIETFESIENRKIKNSITPRITISWAF